VVTLAYFYKNRKRKIDAAIDEKPIEIRTSECMDVQQFWEIIGQSYEKAEGNYIIQQDVLVEILVAMSEEQIIQFDNTFDALSHDAYSWNLWGAAHIMLGGCDDEAFDDFRGWLIAKGESIYNSAMANPETLSDMPFSRGVDRMDGFSLMSYEAFYQKTKRHIPPSNSDYQWIPEGDKWHQPELSAKFPKLWAKFGG
jgi:hypothetical protein